MRKGIAEEAQQVATYLLPSLVQYRQQHLQPSQEGVPSRYEDPRAEGTSAPGGAPPHERVGGAAKGQADPVSLACRLLCVGLEAGARYQQLNLQEAPLQGQRTGQRQGQGQQVVSPPESLSNTQQTLTDKLFRVVAAPLMPQAFSLFSLSPGSAATALADKRLRCVAGMGTLVASRQQKAVQAGLLALAEQISCTPTIQTQWARQGSRQPLNHPNLDYESIFSICILQGLLKPSNSPPWSMAHNMDAWKLPAAALRRNYAPWQGLLSNSCNLEFWEAEVLLTKSQAGQLPSPEEKKAPFFYTFDSLQAILSSCHRVIDGKPSGYATPCTFITLLERHCAVAVCMTVLLHDTLLPVSLTLMHLSAPCSTALLTLLLRHGAPAWQRTKLQDSLCEVSTTLAVILSDPKLVELWMRETGVSSEQKNSHLVAFYTRAVILLFTISLNNPKSVQTTSSLYKVVSVLATADSQRNSKAQYLLPELPRSLMVMVRIMAAATPPRSSGGAWARDVAPKLQACLLSLGDGLVVIGRRSAAHWPQAAWRPVGRLLEVDVERPWLAGADPSAGTGNIFSLKALMDLCSSSSSSSSKGSGVAASREGLPGLTGAAGGAGEEGRAVEQVGGDSEAAGMTVALEVDTAAGEQGQEMEEEGEAEAYDTAGAEAEARRLRNHVAQLLQGSPWLQGALRRWLAAARRYLAGEFSVTERLQREVPSALGALAAAAGDAATGSSGGLSVRRSRAYTLYFQEHACPTRAQAMHLLLHLHDCIQIWDADRNASDEEDEYRNLAERLQANIRMLVDLCDPSHDLHAQASIAWLRSEVLSPLQRAVKDVTTQLGAVIRKMLAQSATSSDARFEQSSSGVRRQQRGSNAATTSRAQGSNSASATKRKKKR